MKRAFRFITYTLKKFKPRGWRRLKRRWAPVRPLRRWYYLRKYSYVRYKKAQAAGRPRKAKLWLTRHREAKRRFKELQEEAKAARVGCNRSSGDPHWGGSASIVEKEVVPVAADVGVGVTSRKRTSTLGNPGSDHYVGNTTAYAVDLGTYSGAELAHAIARSLGISGFSTGNYNSYHINRCGHTFRVQILWAVSGHYDHIHVGVRA